MPGLVRPARPARCWADACEIGDTNSDSTRMRGLNTYSDDEVDDTCNDYGAMMSCY